MSKTEHTELVSAPRSGLVPSSQRTLTHGARAGGLDDKSAAKASGGVSIKLIVALLALIFAVYFACIDLKGISSDEGLRLGIMNGGQLYSLTDPAPAASWRSVLAEGAHYAYQPGYFLLQNAVMKLVRSHDPIVLRLVNLVFLGLSLWGLLVLSRDWHLQPRLFLLSLFSFNSFLMMHVLQVREYILGISCIVWTSVVALDLLKLDVTPRNARTVLPFAGYGLLLAAGMYTQQWIAFPAAAQFMLFLTRRSNRVRFWSRIAIAYAIPLAALAPYFLAQRNKVDVGQWGLKDMPLWSRLADGFHLVLSGQPLADGLAANAIFGFWVLVIAGLCIALFVPKWRSVVMHGDPDLTAQLRLIGLSVGVMLVFQIAYFFAVDTLSVWPRYFFVYYFFLVLLIALAFKLLHARALDTKTPAEPRRWFRGAAAAIMAVMIGSSVYQVWSYHRDPYYDMFATKVCNWDTLSLALAQRVAPQDVIMTPHFLPGWTLYYTWPFTNRLLALPDLQPGVLDRTDRIVMVRLSPAPAETQEISARLGALGFDLDGQEDVAPPNPELCTYQWGELKMTSFERQEIAYFKRR